MNLVNCAMTGAFVLSMPQRPEVDRLTDYYAKAIERKTRMNTGLFGSRPGEYGLKTARRAPQFSKR